jgi:hypothetical protein
MEGANVILGLGLLLSEDLLHCETLSPEILLIQLYYTDDFD